MAYDRCIPRLGAYAKRLSEYTHLRVVLLHGGLTLLSYCRQFRVVGNSGGHLLCADGLGDITGTKIGLPP